MRGYIYIVVSSILLLFSGCSSSNPPLKDLKEQDLEPKSKYISVDDVKEIPQNGEFFAKFVQSYDSFFNTFQEKMDEKFNKIYFKPWHLDDIGYKENVAFWPFDVYPKKVYYGENYLPIDKEWFEYQKRNAQIDKFKSLNKKAIAIVNTDMRNFPSEKPIFGNTKKNAGEGFPFDYSQTSALKVNSPLLVSHLSQDKAWAFVQSSFALGWVPTRDIAFVDMEFINQFENSNYAVATTEKFAVYDYLENFRFFAKVGTIFPILDEKSDRFTVAIPIKNFNSNAIISKAVIKKDYLLKKPIKFNSINTSKLVNNLLHEPYSWGGLLGNRDCSSTTRDFLAPFGIWLPRNSASQKATGDFISLKGFSRETKEELILESAIPFLTLIYLKGHIVLYVGEYNGKPVVMHNTWGIKTVNKGVEGRHIIGKTVITNLDLAKDLRGVKRTLLDRVEGMTILVNSDVQALYYQNKYLEESKNLRLSQYQNLKNFDID